MRAGTLLGVDMMEHGQRQRARVSCVLWVSYMDLHSFLGSRITAITEIGTISVDTTSLFSAHPSTFFCGSPRGGSLSYRISGLLVGGCIFLPRKFCDANPLPLNVCLALALALPVGLDSYAKETHESPYP